MRRRWTPISQSKKKEIVTAYLFLLPSLLGAGIFVLLPFLDVLRRSFITAASEQFVGIENYRQVMQNQAFQMAAVNTIRFMAVCIPMLLVLSLGAAVLLLSGSYFIKFIKTGYLLPMAVPVASAAIFFKLLFDRHGWVNLLVVKMGGEAQDFLSSGKAFWILTACYIWKNIGYDMVLWLAGLSSIPIEQYEAAKVQGAGKWQCFLYITMPQMKQTLFVTGLLSFINAFRVFREAYLIAGDYPHDSIYMLQHLFNNWFTNLDIQKMTAAAVMLVLIVGGVLGVEEFFKDRREKREKQIV